MFNKICFSLLALSYSLSIFGVNVDRPSPIFGRSVVLHANNKSLGNSSCFLVTKKDQNSEWGHYEDKNNKQGDPNWPAQILTDLNLPLGFRFYTDKDKAKYLVIPTFNALEENLKKLGLDVEFYEADGLVPERIYLEMFIKGKIPISRIPESGDAHLFLHDMDYHALGHLLLPVKIRELAQRQMVYFLEFVDLFKKKFGKDQKLNNWIDELITKRVINIDNSMANLLFILLDYGYDFSNLDAVAKNEIHEKLMRITAGSTLYDKGPSVELFMKAILEEYESKEEVLAEELKKYIKSKKDDALFKRRIEIDVIELGFDIYIWPITIFGYNEAKKISWKDAQYEGGYNRTAVDLFQERLNYLRNLTPRR